MTQDLALLIRNAAVERSMRLSSFVRVHLDQWCALYFLGLWTPYIHVKRIRFLPAVMWAKSRIGLHSHR